jgi:hypothetical protein
LAQEGQVIQMVVPLPKLLPEEEAQPKLVCRPPQRMTETRNLGPTVCRTQAQWDALHAQGLDVSADGRGTVQSEKYRSLQVCGRGSC